MYRKLYPASKYPDGHPDLARGISNLGFLLDVMGSYEKALPHYEQALAMNRNLYPASKYPDGHTHLAIGIHNLGFLLQAMGWYEKALPHYEQALAVRQKLGRRVLATASESEALAFVKAQPLARDGFLSLTTHLPNTSASAYGAVWSSKSAITRVLEQRHAAARFAGAEHAAKLDELKGLRRRIDQLLQDRRLPPDERDKLLTKASDDRDALERWLAKKMPMRARAQELDALGPDALAALLPDHTALIDLVRYTRFDFDRAKPGRAGETRTLSYAAFVVGPPLTPGPSPQGGEGRVSIKRIELGEAKSIDQAVVQWRNAIEKRAESPAAKQLHDLVWAKLAPHLPAGTKRLYLALDGDLARMPWAALPTGTQRVLLEDYTLATVPHGPFLLEQLNYPPKHQGDESVLALGDVAYNSPARPDLPGTAVELKSLAFRKPVTLTKSAATSSRLLTELPKARYAHFATHGFFDADGFTKEKKREELAMKNREFGDETRRVVTKNPLGFVGLVLADGDVMTGLSILDMPLENLKLVTLSACETGVGEYTGAKGVENLQMAFHLAGCPNVVASLWNVNDEATAALMGLFYHKMWVDGKSPRDALREAQLFIYHHPDRIPALARDRGPDFSKIVRIPITPPATTPARPKADTKLWAAFVLSGVGN